MTDRERYLVRLFTAPLVKGDVAVVLCGEDAMPRALKGVDLLIQGIAASIYLTGGRAEPGILPANAVEPKLLALGVIPSALERDDEATNTHEQAENVIAVARRRGWRRIALVASPYHLPRAYATFLRSLLDAELGEEVYLMPVAADRTRWVAPPQDRKASRAALLPLDLEKIELYGAKGHVASWLEALDYLDYWEARL